MAAGDLEGKIGELNGQLRMLAPILESLGQKVGGMGERLAAMQENLKQVWHQIDAIKKRSHGSARRGWDIAMALISSVIGAVITFVAMKLTR